jgi:serine/threonine protein phosphatase 1
VLTYVVSDIHGRLDLLDLCLAGIARHGKTGRVVFTGDYIDRGPDSKGVIQRLIDGPKEGWKWDFIRGNHEDFLLEAMKGTDPRTWASNGDIETMKSYDFDVPAQHLDWIDALPRLLWDDQRVYTHAGVSENYKLDEQPEQITQWYRYPKKADVGYHGRHVVHGHTPHHEPELYKNRTNLDTGGFSTGKMCVGVFDDKSGPPIDLITVKGVLR